MATHKRGDTFSYAGECQLKDADGNDIDMSTITVDSQMRMPNGRKVVDFVVTKFQDGGKWFLRLYADNTERWPVSSCNIDVQFTFPGGVIASTSTAEIEIIEDITR